MTPDPLPARTTWSRGRQGAAFAVSVLLVGAAIYGARGQVDPLRTVAGVLTSDRWWLAGAVVGLPLLNWLLTAGVFFVLMLPLVGARSGDTQLARTVGLGEVVLLIGSSWLLNYLPLSPGMVGRVAYHSAVHRIPVTSSLWVIGAAMGIGMVMVVVMLVVVAALAGAEGAVWQTYVMALGAPLIVLALGAWLSSSIPSARLRGLWRYPVAAALRYLDLLVWVARYAAVFELLDHHVSLAQAAGVAAVSQVAMQVPIFGNGLGVREWAVGLAGPALPAWLPRGVGPLAKDLGLSADLLNRAGELLAAVPVGLVCTAMLARRVNAGGDGVRAGSEQGESMDIGPESSSSRSAQAPKS